MNKAILIVFSIILYNCTSSQTKKNEVTQAKISLIDSINTTLTSYDQRLDIKMKRKIYHPTKDITITIQKYFEFGDTNRLIKLRQEIVTKDTQIDVLQYHFIDNQLTLIHEYQYNKLFDKKSGKQMMSEGKYYITHDTIYLALERNSLGTMQNPPIIESSAFRGIVPANKINLQQFKEKFSTINDKYQKLPYSKHKA